MAFIDARTLPENSVIEADLVIVGGGMAGIAIATECAGAGFRVAVLESGDRDLDPEAQDLAAGETIIRAPGLPDVRLDTYLIQSRRRGLGGSGAVWGAKCAPLDEADFAARDWLGETGWPLTRSSMQPYYDRACDLLRIGRFGPDYVDPDRPALTIGGERDYFSAPRKFSPVSGRVPDVFDAFRTGFAEAANINVYLNANVTEIGLVRSGQVGGLDVACLHGRRHTARGRTYVLAAGAIENARLLLASQRRAPAGVGNASGLVGRCFQGHATFGATAGPDGLWTTLCVTDPQDLSLYEGFRPDRPHCVFTATLDGQRRHGTGNFTVTLQGQVAPDRDDVRAILDLAAGLDGQGGGAPARTISCYFMSEHQPNADSRVTLDETNADALGMPRARLEWVYSAGDLDRLERSIAAFGDALGADGKGRLCWPAARAALFDMLSPARHHMGTTRMHPDPEFGVVNGDCRMHGVSNLHIAGGSVFPTSGLANPTLTLIALAMRLSDHLKLELGAAQ